MGNTRGLTDKPITKEVILDEDGRVVAAHLSTVITDPTAANAVQVADGEQYPAANQTLANPLNVHSASSPADAQDPDEGAGVNEVQTLTEGTAITAGTYTLTFQGQTTDPLAYNATAATIQSELRELSGIGPSDVTVTGGPVDTAVVTITFGGNYAAQDVPLLTSDQTSLTGTFTIAEGTKGVHADAP